MYINATEPMIFQTAVLASVKMVVKRDMKKGDVKSIPSKLFLAFSYSLCGIKSPKHMRTPASRKTIPPLMDIITIVYFTTKMSETGTISLPQSRIMSAEKTSKPKMIPSTPIILVVRFTGFIN